MSRAAALAPRHRGPPALGRLGASLAAGTVTAALVPFASPLLRAVAGWDAAALVLLGLFAWTILRSTPEGTRQRADADDPGRAAGAVIVIVAGAASVVAATLVLDRAGRLLPGAPWVAVLLAVTAIVSAWFLTHATYALHYAHLYYGTAASDRKPEGGLEFPGDEAPSDRDFAYFAFVLGMTFQVSDVAVSSRKLRSLALWHGLLSFWYNVAILALSLNVIGGLL